MTRNIYILLSNNTGEDTISATLHIKGACDLGENGGEPKKDFRQMRTIVRILKKQRSSQLRKLARIEKIDDILPIEKANRIKVTTIGGWDVVVKEREHRVRESKVSFKVTSNLHLLNEG